METAPFGFMVKHTLGKASGGTFNLQMDLSHLEVHWGGSNSFYPDETTLVGRIPATAANLRARTPVVATFQIDQTQPGYVRVVAVDRAGNRSGPSEAVACTPRLLKDEYIDSLTVSKLTAGTLTADTILGASIRTGVTGARVDLNPDGLQAYKPDGTKSVDIKSDDGSVSIIGEFKTLNNGDGISIVPGSRPKMKITPNDLYDHHAELFSWNESVGMGMTTELSVRRSSDDEIDGGKVLLWEDGATLSHQPVAGREMYIGLNRPYADVMLIAAGEAALGGSAATILIYGKFGSYVSAQDANQAIFTIGNMSVGNGPVIPSYTYGMTMARTLYPIVSVKSGSDTRVRVGSQSTTGFSVGIDAGTSNAINAWCVAM